MNKRNCLLVAKVACLTCQYPRIATRDPLLKVRVLVNVNSLMAQDEARMASAVVAWWEVFTLDARYVMRRRMVVVVLDGVNA